MLMRASTPSKVGNNTHKITKKLLSLIGLTIFESVVSSEKAKVRGRGSG
jgi:hypothetical protein